MVYRRMDRAISVSLGVVGFVLAICGPAHADTVTLFSNFGPGTTFEPTNYFFGFTPENDEDVPPGRHTPAMPFVAGSDASLDSVTVALRFEHLIGPGTLEVSLYGSDGSVPGALLERFARTSPYVADAALSFASALHPTLLAGNTYWLSLGTTGEAEGAWFFSPDAPGNFLIAAEFPSGIWRNRTAAHLGAFRVAGMADAAPVPEPGTIALLGIGLAGVFRARQRRARAG